MGIGRKTFSLVGSGAVLLLVWLFAVSGEARAQSVEITYTVHLRECPVGHEGFNLYETCHDTGIPGIMISSIYDGKAPPIDAVTDANGDASLVAFRLLAHHLEPPFPIQAQAAYCTDTDSGTSIDVEAISLDSGWLSLLYRWRDVPWEVVNVTCDWYLIPLGSPEPQPTQPADISDGVEQLPNTGAGVSGFSRNSLPSNAALLAVAISAGAILCARTRFPRHRR